jgi:hypothetical protein
MYTPAGTAQVALVFTSLPGLVVLCARGLVYNACLHATLSAGYSPVIDQSLPTSHLRTEDVPQQKFSKKGFANRYTQAISGPAKGPAMVPKTLTLTQNLLPNRRVPPGLHR